MKENHPYDKVIDSYRIELFTHSVEAKVLREALHDASSIIIFKEHAIGGGSIFLINAPMAWREWIFAKYGYEKWFAMEGGIKRNVLTGEIES